jgi:hypothetical protein
MIQETLEACCFNWKALENVWLGITVCNQAEADRDIPKLLAIPAERRFLSVEPMLGPIDLEGAGALGCNCPDLELYDEIIEERCSGSCNFYKHSIDKKMIDQVIVGGETGPYARQMHPEWVRSIRDQCKAVGVPFLFKKWGEWGSAKGISRGVPVRWEFEDGRPAELSHPRSHKKPLRGYVFSDLYQVIRVGKKRSGRLLDGVPDDESKLGTQK